MPISIRSVDALAPGSTLWDTTVRGFGVRRQRRDAVYVLKHRVAGKQRFVTIGRHGAPWTPDTARKEALRILANGLANGTAAAPTGDLLADVIETYLRQSAGWQRPSS